MKCPFCSNSDTKVADTRRTQDDISVKRRRFCENCGERFTTYERVDMHNVVVIKKDGGREMFKPAKLRNSIVISCNKRPVSSQTIDSIVSKVEREAINSISREISSSLIGEIVLSELKRADEVSYIRFVSVNRQFKDINGFISELSALISEKNGV